jgi:hypothetical protein
MKFYINLQQNSLQLIPTSLGMVLQQVDVNQKNVGSRMPLTSCPTDYKDTKHCKLQSSKLVFQQHPDIKK